MKPKLSYCKRRDLMLKKVILKLKRIPHFTALDKFAQRIKQTILDLVLAMAQQEQG